MNNNDMFNSQLESRVQRAFNNAAFFWLDRSEFPLSDFLQACTTNFLLRPDFTGDDAAFILKWIEKQKRDPKSTLNKTLKQQEKIGLVTKDLDIVKVSLKAYMSKPQVSFKSTPAIKAKAPIKKAVKAKVIAKPKAVKKAIKKPAVKKVKAKAIKKPIVKKKVNKKVLKMTKKISILKKVVKKAFLSSLKSKTKKRRAA